VGDAHIHCECAKYPTLMCRPIGLLSFIIPIASIFADVGLNVNPLGLGMGLFIKYAGTRALLCHLFGALELEQFKKQLGL